MDGFKLAMLYPALALLFIIGLMFFNDGVVKFFLFKPSLLFIFGLVIAVFGVILSMGNSSTQTMLAEIIKNNPNHDAVKLDVIAKYLDGLSGQNRVYDYILIPVGAGFMVSAIFMRFTLLLKEMDIKHSINSNELKNMKIDLSNSYRDIRYFLENNARGQKIIDMHNSIKYLDDKIYDAEILFKKDFGASEFKYYKNIK